ncbi:YycH family regulatory protein [Alicyclobacillus vulcanalis]|uniref:Two-component signal transduction system YycFG, regulatory protein YycH n=1 Tax=Alicyclobacillus vulcanalis TaxID=252246 RepID=A0A1N7LN89_9BACL|nr:two-component system activity regulator YycH [Alicyclobacillus vulcanalis]SIS75254.1 Two-component signal transduction system YycFG, regulatory protein YycH [Alicyclobacillus vulcanalis]
MKAWARTLKMVVLALLVAASIVLSYALWSGNLQGGAEIGLTETETIPYSTSPSLASTVRPYEIDIRAGDAYTVVRPGSAAYAAWTAILMGLRAERPQPIAAVPSGASMSVVFQFGVPLDPGIGRPWLGDLATSVGAINCRAIVLTPGPGSDCSVVYEGMDSAGKPQLIEATAPAPASALVREASRDVAEAPYAAWSDFEGESFVPEGGRMTSYVYAIAEPSVMPLVQSFFVNPQALTRIQESKTVTIWTDGSRAVQVDRGALSMQYEDPNASTSPAHTEDYIAAIDFLHAHGGGPANLIGFDLIGMLTVNLNGPTYAFSQYVDGYPILANRADYNFEIDSGHVMEFDRPLWELTKPIRASEVPIMGEEALVKALAKVTGTKRVTLSTFHVELGYWPSTQGLKAGQIRLLPVDYVTNANGGVWVLNAATGELVAGGLS